MRRIAQLRYLADVNVLLALCVGGHTHHGIVKEWLEGKGGVGEVVVCRVAQLGLARLLSNRAVMGESVLELERAWQFGLRLLDDERFAFGREGSGIEGLLAEYLLGRKVSQSVWTDAYLAAFARSAGLGLVSLDRGFLGYEGLRCELLG